MRGIGKAPPELSSATNRKLLKRSVAAICAHSGFDSKFMSFPKFNPTVPPNIVGWI